MGQFSDDVLNTEKMEGIGSLHTITKHMTEEYMAWLYDLKEESWKDEYLRLQTLDTRGLITEIRNLHELWTSYISSTVKTQYSIDEGDGLTVSISLDEVIFNLVNHGTYN